MFSSRIHRLKHQTAGKPLEHQEPQTPKQSGLFPSDFLYVGSFSLTLNWLPQRDRNRTVKIPLLRASHTVQHQQENFQTAGPPARIRGEESGGCGWKRSKVGRELIQLRLETEHTVSAMLCARLSHTLQIFFKCNKKVPKKKSCSLVLIEVRVQHQ